MQVVAAEEVVLRHLAAARRYSRGGSVASDLGVAQHGARLPERADEVLALGQVDAGLAADGGVDLAEQRGRRLHDGDPPVVARRRRTRRCP